jgi:hypothetical protein
LRVKGAEMLCFGLGKRNRMIAARRIVRALAGRRVLVWVHYEDLRVRWRFGRGLGRAMLRESCDRPDRLRLGRLVKTLWWRCVDWRFRETRDGDGSSSRNLGHGPLRKPSNADWLVLDYRDLPLQMCPARLSFYRRNKLYSG